MGVLIQWLLNILIFKPNLNVNINNFSNGLIIHIFTLKLFNFIL